MDLFYTVLDIVSGGIVGVYIGEALILRQINGTWSEAFAAAARKRARHGQHVWLPPLSAGLVALPFLPGGDLRALPALALAALGGLYLAGLSWLALRVGRRV